MAVIKDNPALRLRAAARGAMLDAGGRGFVRFLPEGRALFVTDAAKRAPVQSIVNALEQAGFDCCLQADGLITFSPSDALIARMTEGPAPAPGDDYWNRYYYTEWAMAERFMRRERAPLTDAGRQLIYEALRMQFMPPDWLSRVLGVLRARAAVMLRTGDDSGMAEAGRLLAMHLQSIGQSADRRDTE